MNKYSDQTVQEVKRLYTSGQTIYEVSAQLGMHYQTVSRYLEQQGVSRRPNYRQWSPQKIAEAVRLYKTGMSLAEVGRKLGGKQGTVSKYIRQASIPVRTESFYSSGNRNPAWKNGRHISKGYVSCYAPDHPYRTQKNHVAEHRLVMEKQLGRFLLPTEVVHHRNGDTMDNRPENLELFSSNGEHLAETLRGQIPKWSEDGLRRLRQAQRAAKVRQSA